jgi:UDPglucose 6-dehydrogenase
MRFRIIEAVLEVNEQTKRRMVTKIRDAVGDLAGSTIALLGLSFKPDTDDIRESPALTILAELLAEGADIRAFDPAAMDETRQLFPGATYVSDPYEAVKGADAAVIVTEWNLFRALEPARLRELMRRPLIVDLRNIYEPEKMAEDGFDYVSVGRPSGHGAPAPEAS